MVGLVVAQFPRCERESRGQERHAAEDAVKRAAGGETAVAASWPTMKSMAIARPPPGRNTSLANRPPCAAHHTRRPHTTGCPPRRSPALAPWTCGGSGARRRASSVRRFQSFRSHHFDQRKAREKRDVARSQKLRVLLRTCFALSQVKQEDSMNPRQSSTRSDYRHGRTGTQRARHRRVSNVRSATDAREFAFVPNSRDLGFGPARWRACQRISTSCGTATSTRRRNSAWIATP